MTMKEDAMDQGRRPPDQRPGAAAAPPVVGLTGPNAAGTGEVAHFLERQGYLYHSLSDVVREEATARGLDHSRENLIRVGNELRREFGPGVLAERIVMKLRVEGVIPKEEPGRTNDAPGHPKAARAVVDSVRSPAEVAVLRRVTGFVFLGIDAPIALRFERAALRSRVGDGATLAEFARKEALENTNDPAAQQLAQTLLLADLVVANDNTLEVLHARVAAALHIDFDA